MISDEARLDLTKIKKINTDIKTFLPKNGEVFKIFDQQDSGCMSYGVKMNGQRWFIKEFAEQRTVDSFYRAITLHRELDHPALGHLCNNFETPKGGLALVYDWLPGEIVYSIPEYPGETGRKIPNQHMPAFVRCPSKRSSKRSLLFLISTVK